MAKQKAKRKKRMIRRQPKFPAELITAARGAGLSHDQIAAYDDEASLRAVVNRLKPTMLSGAGVPSPSKPPREPVEMVETTKTLTIMLSPIRAKTPLRGDDEERQIQAFINKGGIRRTMFKQELLRSYEPEKDTNKYLTEVVIHYRVPKE